MGQLPKFNTEKWGPFSLLASCCVTKIGIGGFFLAIYRIICLKWPLQGMKKLKQISNELIVLEWITAFFLSGIHMSGIGFTGTDLSLAFCRYLYLHTFWTIKYVRSRSYCSKLFSPSFVVYTDSKVEIQDFLIPPIYLHLNFCNSPVWYIAFDELDFFPSLNWIFCL